MWALGLALLTFLAGPASAQTPPGTAIDNVATGRYVGNGGASEVATSNLVGIVVALPRTPSTTVFLKHAPSNPSATLQTIGPEQCSLSGGAVGPFGPIAPPVSMAGVPIDLGAPVPLLGDGAYHAGEPVFVRVTDPDQNLSAAVVETVGFHESGHDGSKPWPVNDVESTWTVLDSRERDTHPRSAADVVVAPGTEIRSPVTGTVVAAQTYVLYCEHSDDLLFIEPDEQPGWQVRIFHISGLQVSVGDRVEAGVTVIAPSATQLPFVSQVDDETAEPSWPHVHIEIVDPSIPDRPTATPGCN